MGEFFNTLKDNWAVIADAPWAALALFLLALGLAFLAIRALYQAQIDTLRERLQHRDEKIAQLTESGLTPTRLSEIETQLRSLAPRKLSDEEKAKMHEVLGDDGGKIIIGAELSAPDGMPLRQDLWYVFHRAGWDVATAIVMGRRNAPPCGVAVKVPDPQRLTPKQSRVIRALTAIGFKHELAQDHIGDADVEIEITARIS